MPGVAMAFERSVEPRHASWTDSVRRLLWALLGALDRLVSPHRHDGAGPPPEWFKYAPI